jgi:hypothetical protein
MDVLLRRICRLALPLGLIFAVPAGVGLAQGEGAHEVVILHDTHFHGKFGPEDEANIARYAALVERLKEGRDNVLFVGNGDDLAPSLFASIYHGSHMIDALNAMGSTTTRSATTSSTTGRTTSWSRWRRATSPG